VCWGFDCPKPNGIFADPEDCSKFYNCANGKANGETCNDDMLFDEELLICNRAENVNCGERPIPGPVTTPHTTTPHTTTTGRPVPPLLPERILGLYILLADDYHEGFETNATWNPLLYDWQQTNANVLFFTFIEPGTMSVPLPFKKLAATRGTGADGAVGADQLIMFAIGGYQYSIVPCPWPWLTSKEAAESMAEKVAKWPELYGCDGIDLDIETGAGDYFGAADNMLIFINKLKELNPSMIVTQPTYGDPQVAAENNVINHSWTKDGQPLGVASSIGIMVYEGTQALQFVDNYAASADIWYSKIKINVPYNNILVGSKGGSSSGTIISLAEECLKTDLMGIMVWYASVRDGLVYAPEYDASAYPSSYDAYGKAYQMFKNTKTHL